MPANPTSQPRAVGASGETDSNSAAPAASSTNNKPLNPRPTTLEGERKVLQYVVDQLGDAESVCVPLGDLAEVVNMTKETMRLRIDSLRDDGRLRREPCWCTKFGIPHARFHRPDAGVLEAAAAAVVTATEAFALKAEERAAALAEEKAAKAKPAAPADISEVVTSLIDLPADFKPGRPRQNPLPGYVSEAAPVVVAPAVALPAAPKPAPTAPVVAVAVTAAPVAAPVRVEPVVAVTVRTAPVAVVPAASAPIAAPSTAAALAAPSKLPVAVVSAPAVRTPAAAPTPLAVAAPVAPAAAAPVVGASVPQGVAEGFSQVFAAQPDSWALYRVGSAVWRDPIVAWGVWAEKSATGFKNVAGPLVFGNAGLVAANSVAGFVGVRLGTYRVLEGERSFDSAAQAVEPA